MSCPSEAIEAIIAEVVRRFLPVPQWQSKTVGAIVLLGELAGINALIGVAGMVIAARNRWVHFRQSQGFVGGAASLLVLLAKDNGLTRVDYVVLSGAIVDKSARYSLFVVQFELDDSAHLRKPHKHRWTCTWSIWMW